jgi:phosphate uptake regulator
MRRKLIKQGNNALTVTLPAKWLKENSLEAGNEISIEEDGNLITIQSTEIKEKPKKSVEITLDKKQTKSYIRMTIVNAYRAGFDTITIHTEISQKEITSLVNRFLTGFELFKKKENIYIAESISEPNENNFENMLNKMFYLLKDHISTIEDSDFTEQAEKVQRYDNFLKRCLSKGVVAPEYKVFLWQFLTQLTHVSRACYHFNNQIKKEKLVLDEEAKKLLEDTKEMIENLRKAYVLKDLNFLKPVHQKQKEIVFNKGPKLLKKKDNLVFHNIIVLARVIYVSNSPLIGVIHLQTLEKN